MVFSFLFYHSMTTLSCYIDTIPIFICAHAIQGQDFPTILQESRRSTGNAVGTGGGAFDRVLCDAPCSGDGTLRKTPNIWGKWSTSSAYSLYPLQLMIAQRGLKLLKEGGIMVYSTCSMSPYGEWLMCRCFDVYIVLNSL